MMCNLCGCGKVPEAKSPEPATNSSAEESSAQTVVKGFTGKIAVDQGIRAKDQINAIKESRKKDREEVMP